MKKTKTSKTQPIAEAPLFEVGRPYTREQLSELFGVSRHAMSVYLTTKLKGKFERELTYTFNEDVVSQGLVGIGGLRRGRPQKSQS